MREVVLDTETTGLDVESGHRIIEIGCVELIDRNPTGRTYHSYFNPQRRIDYGAKKVHGMDEKFLADKPLFADKVQEIIEFIGDAPLVAHNANFDLSFLNGELERLDMAKIDKTRLIDTLALANKRHPGGRHTLDRLCKLYKVDASRRTNHGALLDAELLAAVYPELIGERQGSMALVKSSKAEITSYSAPRRPVPLPSRLHDADIAAHLEFIANGGFKEMPIWFDYIDMPMKEAA